MVLGGTTGTAAIKRASTQDIMRLRGSKKAAATPAEAVCCGDDDGLLNHFQSEARLCTTALPRFAAGLAHTLTWLSS